MKMSVCTAVLAAVALVVGGAAEAAAQSWRGMGRIAGKVVDENGKPLEGVTVKAMFPRDGNAGPSEGRTNKDGNWAVGGIAGGEWALDFMKEGYETKQISISVSESQRIPPMEIVMAKVVPVVDPNVEIKEQLTKAAALMNAKQYAQARAIYEELSAKYPEVPQFLPLIARTYHREGNTDKAIEHLRAASAADPDNVGIKVLLAEILLQAGKRDEGRRLLETVDPSKVTDPAVFVNIGIDRINRGSHAEAIPWFDKAIAQFPDHPDAYYFRGISHVSLGNGAEARADLEKFVSMVPSDSAEVATAKKLLESIK